MKHQLAVQVAMLLFPVVSLAAKVEYQHPDVTIVAVSEPLDSVLTTLGKEMQLNVTSPIGVNPVINCDIQNQPIKQAFKNLLGDLSYSLVWADGGERLTGLVILRGDGEPGEASVSGRQSSGATSSQFVFAPSAGGSSSHSAAAHDPGMMAEHEAQVTIRRQEQEARMTEEREAQELEMAQIQQEKEVVHKARMAEERANMEARTQASIEAFRSSLRQ